MNVRKSLIFKLSLLIAFSGYIQESWALSDNQKIAIGAAVVGGGIAICAIVKALGNTRSAHQSTINGASVEISSDMTFVVLADEMFKMLQLTDSSTEAQKVRAIDSTKIDSASQAQYDGFILPIIHEGITDYLAKLNKAIKNLKNHRDNIKHAVFKLRTKEDCQDLFNKASDIKVQINLLIPKLELLEKFLTKHQAYFKLAKVVIDCNRVYEADFKLLSNNKPAQALKENARAINVKAKYPLKEYVDQINSYIESIEQSRSSYSYSNLNVCIKAIKSKLVEIRKFVVNDKEYLKEKRDCQIDLQKAQELQAKIDLENKKLSLAAQKAHNEKVLKEREVAAREQAAQAELLKASAALESAKAKNDLVEQKKIENQIKILESIKKEAAELRAAQPAIDPSAPPAYAPPVYDAPPAFNPFAAQNPYRGQQ